MINPSAFQVWTGQVQSLEMKYTPSGTAMAKLVIRYPSREKPAGEDEFKTVSRWSPFLTVWGQSAEAMNGVVRVGMTLTVTTSYKRDKVEKDGETNWYDNYTVEQWQIASWHTDGGSGEASADVSAPSDFSDFDADEDIPF